MSARRRRPVLVRRGIRTYDVYTSTMMRTHLCPLPWNPQVPDAPQVPFGARVGQWRVSMTVGSPAPASRTLSSRSFARWSDTTNRWRGCRWRQVVFERRALYRALGPAAREELRSDRRELDRPCEGGRADPTRARADRQGAAVVARGTGRVPRPVRPLGVEHAVHQPRCDRRCRPQRC